MNVRPHTLAMKILILTSTFPSKGTDPVPDFVKEQVIAMGSNFQNTCLNILAPHDSTMGTKDYSSHAYYDEHRFHYFWPRRYEKFMSKGIIPTLRANRLYYFVVPFYVLSEYFAIRKLAKSISPDVIYAHWFTPQAVVGALVSKQSGIPLVFTTHSSDMVILGKLPFHKKIIEFVMRHTHRWTAVSNRTVEKTKSLFTKQQWNKYKQNMAVIPMGVHVNDIGKFNINKVPEQLSKIGQGNKPVILYLGRLAEVKGVDILIKAFSKLKSYNSKLVIAGTGPDEEKLVEFAKKLGLSNKVHFVGYVHSDAKKYLLKVADCLVVPSIKDSGGHTEGLPVVLMEGIAAGKIVIASDQSNAKEIISDGVNGFLYESTEIKQLARTIDNIISLDSVHKARVQAQARNTAKQFDWPIVAVQHCKFLFNSLPVKQTENDA